MSMGDSNCLAEQTTDWQDLADRILEGHELTTEEGLSILRSNDDELLDLLAATYRVRRKHFGRKVHLYFLKNAKSGLCPEDCGYCSQSIISEAEIPRYALLNEAKLMEGAERAVASQARTYCIVASGRGPSNREVDHIASTVTKIKDKYGLHICCCLGLLNAEQAQTLKDAGAIRVVQSEKLHETIESLLANATERAELSKNARDAVLANKGASAKHAEMLFSLLGKL